METSVFNRQHIYFDTMSKSQDEAFKVIARLAYEAGFVSDENTYYEGLWEREKEATTGFQDGIAIPHSKSITCIKPGVFLVKFKEEIAWNSLDSKPTQVAIALTIPNEGGKQHLKILSKIARKLIDEDFRKELKQSMDVEKLYDAISTIEI